MVEVKIIRRPKSSGTGTGRVTGTGTVAGSSVSSADYAKVAGEAQHALDALHADTADYAATAGIADIARDLTPDSPANDRFVRKDRADRTPYALSVGGQLRAEADALVSRLLTAAGGVQFGNSFASGLTGFGGFIDSLGHGELRSLRLWEFLEVPELRYNRVTLVNRIQWATPGAGIIESVIPDIRPDGTPDVTGTVILKLEEGEYGTLSTDDICMGIWHDTSQTDATCDDGRGNFVFRGFRTIYFRITGVSDDSKTLRYMLRPGYPYHPSQGMHFAAYGNFIDPDRQKSRYMTDSYIRFLHDVDDWEFDEMNIAAQFGDLSNLTIGGVPMKGYSIYMDNVYMSGTIHQIKVTPPVLTVDVEGGNGRDVAPGEEVAVTCRVTKAMTAFSGPVAWRVTRSTGDADADEAWDRDHAGFDGTLSLTYADLGGHWRPAFTVEAVCDDDGTPYTLRETVILRRTEAYVEDTGPWTAGRKYLDGTATDAQGRLVTHDAWLYGARWRCAAIHTSDEGNRPGYGSQFWEYVGGIPDEFSVSFDQASDNAPQDPRRPYIPLTVRAVYRGEDVTQYIADSDCEWSRYSENEAGEERVAMDAVWNAANRWRGRDVVLTEEDCQTRYGGYPEGVGRLVFTVVVTLRDPGGDSPLARRTMSITAE